MYKNSFDLHGECSKMGEHAEATFSQLLSTKGTVRPATTPEQYSHVDFVLTTPDNLKFKYEVKGRKRTSRSDSEVNDQQVWIEFLNVQGNAGWLYGKADYVAFEREHDFLVVNRLKLKDMAETKCDLAAKVSSASAALYKGYRRFRRQDLISIVMMSDIEAIAEEIWKK